ncbi:MAG: hypothetical protein QM786_08450 [Breznakibacter sp.]
MNLFTIILKQLWFCGSGTIKKPLRNFLKDCRILALLLISLNTVTLSAQINDTTKDISPVLVTNHTQGGSPVVKIKWLTDKLIYLPGVNIYRQELGEITWKKLNENPIIKGKIEPSPSQYKADSTLRGYIDMAKDLKPADLKEMTKVFVLVKSVQSESFALYLGIQYDDMSILQNVTYRYKITAISAKGEEVIGYSEFIKAGVYIPGVPPSGIAINANDKRANINWLPEDLRFHGVNIYRSSSVDTALRKINEVPLMISQRELPSGKLSYPDVFFTDGDLENKVRYTYQLTAIDFFGRESGLSEKISVMPGDHTPPLEPYGLRRRIDKYDVRLSWINRPTLDQEGINIYRSYKYDDHYQRINDKLLPVTDTVYTDRDLKAGFYYYIVAAVDSAGNEGKSSKILSEVHDITPPAMPQNVIAKADTGRIVLSWDANTELDLAGYQVFRTVNSDRKDFYVLLNAEPLKQTTFTDTLPRNARNYFFYKVAAMDSAMNRSEYSVPGKAQMPDVTPPVLPVIIDARPKGDYISVEWIANREPDLAGYELFRFTDGPKDKEKINTGLLAPSVTRFTDRTVIPDTLYYYALQAIDSTGNRSPFSESFPGKLPGNRENEEKSEILKFTAKKPLFGKYTKLQWTANTTDSFLGYALFRRNSPDAEPVRVLNLTPDHEFSDYDKNKLNVEYQLRLFHKSGIVVKSEWISLK